MKKKPKIKKYTPKYAKGGQKIGQFFGNLGTGLADTTLGVLGMPNVITEDNYYGSDSTKNTLNSISGVTGKIGGAAGSMALNTVIPGLGSVASTATGALGQATQKYDEQGNPIMAMGGRMNYNNPNASIEKQEVVKYPYGGTGQVDVGTHESGNDADVNLPQGTKIYSDRLKHPVLKKTFAKLAEKYKLNKEEKVLEDNNSSSTAKFTAKLNMDIKNQKLDEIFNEQESLKQSKVQKYANKMGVTLPTQHQMPDGSMMNDSEMYANGGRVTMGYQDPRVTGGVDMTNPSSVQYNNTLGNYDDKDSRLFEYKSGGIHIKPSHRGRFTAYKERTGKTTAEALHSSDPHVRQMANFARNAAKWKHAYGGMQYPDGGQQPLQPIPTTDPTINPYFFNNTANYDLPVDQLGQLKAHTSAPIQPNYDMSLDQVSQLKAHKPLYSNNNLYPKYENGGINDDNYDPFQEQATNNQYDIINNFVDNQPKNPNNYKQFIAPAASVLAQSAGSIYDLYSTRFGKKYDKENYGQMAPKYIDYSQSLKDADSRARSTEDAIKNATNGNTGAYLSNRIAAQSGLIQDKARIREAGEQTNTGIYNQFLPLNKQLEMQSRQDTQQNKARSEDIARMAGRGLASTIPGAYKDYKATTSDSDIAKMMQESFRDPEFKKYYMDYLKKRGGR